MSAFLAMSGFMSVFVFMSAANAAPPQPALINSADATPNPTPASNSPTHASRKIQDTIGVFERGGSVSEICPA